MAITTLPTATKTRRGLRDEEDRDMTGARGAWHYHCLSYALENKYMSCGTSQQV